MISYRKQTRRWAVRVLRSGWLAEDTLRIRLFGERQAPVHEAQDREHRQREDGRPLQQETKHDQHKGNVLWVPHPCATGAKPVKIQVEATPRWPVRQEGLAFIKQSFQDRAWSADMCVTCCSGRIHP